MPLPPRVSNPVYRVQSRVTVSRTELESRYGSQQEEEEEVAAQEEAPPLPPPRQVFRTTAQSQNGSVVETFSFGQYKARSGPLFERSLS